MHENNLLNKFTVHRNDNYIIIKNNGIKFKVIESSTEKDVFMIFYYSIRLDQFIYTNFSIYDTTSNHKYVEAEAIDIIKQIDFSRLY